MKQTKPRSTTAKNKTAAAPQVNDTMRQLEALFAQANTANEFYKKLLATLALAPEEKIAIFKEMWQSTPRTAQETSRQALTEWFNWMDPLNITRPARTELGEWAAKGTQETEAGVTQLIDSCEQARQLTEQYAEKWTVLAENLGISATNFRALESEKVTAAVLRQMPMTAGARKQIDLINKIFAENSALAEKIKKEMSDFSMAYTQWHKTMAELNDWQHLEGVYEQFTRPVRDGQEKLKSVVEDAQAQYPALGQLNQQLAANYKAALELNPLLKGAEATMTAFARSLEKVRESRVAAAPVN